MLVKNHRISLWDSAGRVAKRKTLTKEFRILWTKVDGKKSVLLLQIYKQCSWVWLRHDMRQEKPQRKHIWFLHIFFNTCIFSDCSAFQAVITIHVL